MNYPAATRANALRYKRRAPAQNTLHKAVAVTRQAIPTGRLCAVKFANGEWRAFAAGGALHEIVKSTSKFLNGEELLETRGIE